MRRKREITTNEEGATMDRIHQIEIADNATEIAEVVLDAAAELNCDIGDEVSGDTPAAWYCTEAAWYDESAEWFEAETADPRNRDGAVGMRTMARVLRAAAEHVRHLTN